jgi:monolysocardiolipin acyltransferase
MVGHVSRAFMTVLNTTTIEGAEHVAAALQRPANQPLISVSNHVAAMDDPLVVATLLPSSDLLNEPERLRCVQKAWHGRLQQPWQG